MASLFYVETSYNISKIAPSTLALISAPDSACISIFYFNDYFEAFTHISGFNIFYYPDHNNDKINILKNEILILL
jgi:hypothetical protein